MESVIGDLVTSSIEQGGPMGTPIGLTSPRELDREHYARILTSGGVPHRYELLDYQYIRGGFIHLLERPSWAIALQREEQRKAAAGGKEKDGPPGGWNRQGNASEYPLPGYPNKKLRIERMRAREPKVHKLVRVRKLEIWLVDKDATDRSPVPSVSIIHYRDEEAAMDLDVPLPVVLRQLPAQAASSVAGPSSDAGQMWPGGADALADLAEEPMPPAAPKAETWAQPTRKSARRR